MLKKRIVIPLVLAVILTFLVIFFSSAPPSPLYYLKISRETIQNFFVFGDEDKANWFLTRADKRLTEAQKLKSLNLNFLASTQIETAINYQSEAEILLSSLKDKTNINYLKDKYIQNSDKIKTLQD